MQALYVSALVTHTHTLNKPLYCICAVRSLFVPSYRYVSIQHDCCSIHFLSLSSLCVCVCWCVCVCVRACVHAHVCSHQGPWPVRRVQMRVSICLMSIMSLGSGAPVRASA